MESIRKVVGKNIRFYRLSKGFTQEGLAEKVDVSSTYIGYLERCQKSPSLELISTISKALEIEPALLLTPLDKGNDELNRLISLLSGKAPHSVTFVHNIATAYFKSLEDHDYQRDHLHH
ncbi:MAG TPA: helix-turn-helix transcriptional regulator [Desulfosporosinus sp.]|nr:helix-turn-helix transcriptional regulator [Desulfosporosinus sp.]